MAFVSHHRSIASVHSSAASYWARPCRAHTSSQRRSCRQRIEVPGNGRHPGLLEQRQTLLDIAVQDEQPGLCYPSDGESRRVTLGAASTARQTQCRASGQVTGCSIRS